MLNNILKASGIKLSSMQPHAPEEIGIKVSGKSTIPEPTLNFILHPFSRL